VQDIVEQKVQVAMKDKKREFEELQTRCKSLEENKKITDQTIQQLTSDKSNLLDKVQGLQDDLRFYTQGSQAQDSIARIESLRHERDT